MIRRNNPSQTVRRHRRERQPPWQWLATPARRAALLAVTGAMVLVGAVVVAATLVRPDGGTLAQGDSRSRSAADGSADQSSGDGPSRPGSSSTEVADGSTDAAASSSDTDAATATVPAGRGNLTRVPQLPESSLTSTLSSSLSSGPAGTSTTWSATSSATQSPQTTGTSEPTKSADHTLPTQATAHHTHKH